MIIYIDEKTKEVLNTHNSMPDVDKKVLNLYIDIGDVEINLLYGKYFFIENKIKFIPYDFNLIKSKFDYTSMQYIETATLEQQIEYYKNIIIEKTREHELLKASGFSGTQDEITLQSEIENLKQIYIDKNHELALQIENRLK